MKVQEIQRKQINTKSHEEVKEMIKKMRKEDDKMVKGHFDFIEAQGGWFEFMYRFYPGEPIRYIQLIHGETCELPMGVVKLLNNTKKKIRKYENVEVGEMGKTPRTFETTSRVRFVPVDFM